MKKFALRTAFGTAALGVACVAALNIINHTINAELPNPAEYAKKHGIEYSEATKTGLKEYDHLKVMERGSALWKKWCAVNPLGKLKNSLCAPDAVSDGIYYPPLGSLILGERDLIIMKPVTENALSQEVARWTGKEPTNPKITVKIYISYSLLHELGHERLRNDRSKLSAYDRELGSDRMTIPVMAQEHGEVGSQFPIYYRALHMLENDPHNNYLSLSRAPLQNYAREEELKTQEQNSVHPYQELAKICIEETSRKYNPFVEQTPQQKQQRFSDFTECQAKDYYTRPSQDAQVLRRQEGLAKAYEYFFPK